MSEDLNKHLESQLDEEEERQPSELDSLKARADMMGVKYHPSISLEKLRERVEAKINGKPLDDEDEASGAGSLASTGVTFQPELHVLTISTKEVPLSFRVFSNALRIAAFALRTLAGV